MDTSSKMSIVQQKKQAGANDLGTTSSTAVVEDIIVHAVRQ